MEALYEGGLVTYQEVIDLQRGVFGADLQVSQALQLHHSAVVQLYKALGGGWTPPEGWTSIAEPEEAEPETTQPESGSAPGEAASATERER